MITKDLSPLDIVEQHPETEDVFRTYDEALGKCLLCHCLFDSLETIAGEGDLDLSDMLKKLRDAMAGE